MNRRDMMSCLAALPAAVATFGSAGWAADTALTGADGPFIGPGNPLAAPWAAWKAAYLNEDGRVIDALQQGASHSESQGYGLYLAALFGDDAAFDAIHGWTEANLAIRSDALLAWRWLPDVDGAVPDRNNASDGDLFYAWALVTRAQRDGDAALMDRARAIAADLAAACVTQAPDGSGRSVLKPAAQGFDGDGGIVVNPSYYMPRAMRDVARATGVRALATCAADGVAMMADLAGKGLVPDWIEITPEGMKIPADRKDRNGYEALRVALFLIWSGHADHAAVAVQARAYRRVAAARPATSERALNVTVFDPRSGDVLEVSDHVGYGAVAALTECAASDAPGSAIPFYRTVDQAYYPATLHLMALIAQITAAPECVPI